MSVVYLVSASQAPIDYDHHPDDEVVCVSMTKERADDIVAKLREINAYNKAFSVRHRDAVSAPRMDRFVQVPCKPKPSEKFAAMQAIPNKQALGAEFNRAWKQEQEEHRKMLEAWKTEYAKVVEGNNRLKQQYIDAKNDWGNTNYNPSANSLDLLEPDDNYFTVKNLNLRKTNWHFYDYRFWCEGVPVR